MEEYLERRAAALSESVDAARAAGSAPGAGGASQPTASAGELREARKTVARLDKQLSRLAEREASLHAEMVEHASDYERLASVDVALREVTEQKADLEEQWLDAATLLD